MLSETAFPKADLPETADGPASFRPAVFSTVGTTPETTHEASSARARGYAAGYAAGRRAAEADVRAQRADLQRRHEDVETERQRALDAAVATLDAAAASLQRCTLPVVEDASRLLAESALELAQAVLGTELLDAAHGARAALARALDGIETATVQAVRMHPEDLAALPAGLAVDERIRLVADHRLQRGDAVTEFADGFLDARIGEALARCRAALRGDDA